MATIFSKIIAGEIPADIVYQDEQVTAFRDIEPQAPIHILIVPNKEIPTVNDMRIDDEQLVGHMFTVAQQIALREGIAEDGYRLLVNCNKNAGQEVFHLHMHFFAGSHVDAPLSSGRIAGSAGDLTPAAGLNR
jgi:histidine triad (HIT) family protein